MKRIISLALVALLAVALFAGCGNKDGGSAKNVDLNAVLDTINSENNLSLDKVTDIAMVKRYYNVAEEDVKQFAVESDKSNPNAPVEIVLIEAKDADALQFRTQHLHFLYPRKGGYGEGVQGHQGWQFCQPDYRRQRGSDGHHLPEQH